VDTSSKVLGERALSGGEVSWKKGRKRGRRRDSSRDVALTLSGVRTENRRGKENSKTLPSQRREISTLSFLSQKLRGSLEEGKKEKLPQGKGYQQSSSRDCW